MTDETLRSGIGVLGVGKYIPTKILTNEQVAARTGVPTETIVEKTGIISRYIVEEDDCASEISAVAANDALAMAALYPDQLDLVVGCTFSGDYIFPAMACKVQDIIGAGNAGAFDLLANCTGFQVGLGVVADTLRGDGQKNYGLVLGTAIQSRFIQWSDPESIYFGDGAGAALLGRVPAGYGVLASEVFTNGRVFDAVRLRGGGSSHPLRAENIDTYLQYYEMNGLEVWKQVIQHQPKVIRRSLEKIGKKIEDVDFFIFHQANLRLIEYLMAKMKQPMRKTYTNVERIGNTADASLAIALCEAVEEGCMERGDLVVISGVGAGFTFGSTVIRWF
jgi:3-oxoacyl-[acyl-carrier-protein] synthase III